MIDAGPIKNIRPDEMEFDRGIVMVAEEYGLTEAELINWISSGNYFLDLGTGKGRFISELFHIKQNGLLPNTKLVGLDALPGEKTSSVKGFFEHLPFPDSSIDRVNCLATVGYYAETLNDLKQQLSELARIVPKGGEVLMYLNPHGVKSTDPKEVMSKEEFKVLSFDRKSQIAVRMIDFLQEFGFKVVEKRPCGRQIPGRFIMVRLVRE